jgi:hypothetical protein
LYNSNDYHLHVLIDAVNLKSQRFAGAGKLMPRYRPAWFQAAYNHIFNENRQMYPVSDDGAIIIKKFAARSNILDNCSELF